MRPDDQTRITHLREAATKAIGYCENRGRADLDTDELLPIERPKVG